MRTLCYSQPFVSSVAAEHANLWRGLTTMKGQCETANSALKNALRLVKMARSTRVEALPRIESSSHYNALDTVTQTVSDLNKEVSKIMERETSDSDDDDDSDD
jgi:phage-related minor tail protein